MHQNTYRVCRQWQGAVGVFRFQWCFDYFAILPRDGPLDFQHTTVEVNVCPFQPQQFATAQSGGKVEVVELSYTPLSLASWKKALS